MLWGNELGFYLGRDKTYISTLAGTILRVKVKALRSWSCWAALLSKNKEVINFRILMFSCSRFFLFPFSPWYFVFFEVILNNRCLYVLTTKVLNLSWVFVLREKKKTYVHFVIGYSDTCLNLSKVQLVNDWAVLILVAPFLMNSFSVFLQSVS